jgi:hypothetical protein
VTKPGRFEVTAEIAAEGSGTFTVDAGGGKLTATAPKTGSYTTFQKVSLGTLEISKAGVTTLAVRPVPAGWQPMNLKSIRLEPK